MTGSGSEARPAGGSHPDGSPDEVRPDEVRTDDVRAAVVGVGAVSVVAAGGYAVFGGATYTADFTQLWAVTHAALAGASPYDEAAAQALAPAGAEWPVLPWAYPPWTVLLLLPLGALPLDAAGRVWTLLSAGGLLFAGYLAIGPAPLRARAAAMAAAALSLPALGVVVVGQLAAPVAVGAALLAAARGPAGVAAGLVLVATKPHLGAPVAAAHLGRALVTRDGAAARGWAAGALAGAALAGASFAIDPAWPSAWPAAVARLRASDTVRICDTCASATTALAGSAPGAAALAGLVAAALGVAWVGRERLRDRAVASGAGVLAGLVFLPYVRNYDHALIAVPLGVAAARTDRAGRLVLGLAWLLPYALAGLDRATATVAYWVAALAVGAVLLAGPPAARAA